MLAVKKQIAFTSGSIWRQMIKFALPIVATSIILQLFGTADMSIAGLFLGKSALAAVGSTSTISQFFIEFFLGFSNAANVVVSQLLGKGEEKKANTAVQSIVMFALICGVFVAVVGFFVAKPVLKLMSTPEDIVDSAADYLKIYFLGMPFFMLYNFCAALFRANGETQKPMFCLISGGVLKLVLNLLFVTAFDFGVKGMAIATVCSNALSAFLLIFLQLKRKDYLKLTLSKIKLHKKTVLSLLKIGLPSGFLGSVFSVSNVCVQSAINSLGTNAVAACSAASNVEIYIQYFGNAFAQTATTFIGRNYGAGKYERLNKITLSAILLCNAVTVTLSIISFGFAKSLLGIFVSDVAVITLAVSRMKYTLLFKPIQAVMDIMTGCLQGYGYTFVPALISIFGVCGVRLLWIYTVFQSYHTLGTLMLIYPLTQLLAAISHTICYIFVNRKNKTKKLR